MADLTKVVLDAMGGDHAPGEMVKGAVDAVSRRQDIKVSRRTGSCDQGGT